MKKFLIVMVVMFALVSMAFAGYADYYKARSAAKSAEKDGNVGKAVEMYLSAEAEASVLAAQDGMKLPWKLYAEWQRNNAANALIDSFKAVTGWVEAMEAMKLIPNGPGRLKAAFDLKDKARVSLGLLEEAKSILEKGQFTKAEVMAKVKSNKEFCDWVLEFCK